LLERDPDTRQWPTVPTLISYEQLLDLHRQLIDEFGEIGDDRTEQFTVAARLVHDVMELFQGTRPVPAAAVVQIPDIVVSIVEGLRFVPPSGRRMHPARRFAKARCRFEHMQALTYWPLPQPLSA
jgi:hypothetical protein